MTIAEIETIRRALDTEVYHKEYVKNVTKAKNILNKYETLQASQDQSKLLLGDVSKSANAENKIKVDDPNAPWNWKKDSSEL